MDSGQCSNTGHNDGTCRLYKAHITGAAQLPAWVLTPAETLAIRARADGDASLQIRSQAL